jgi:hypothetical protein
MTVRARVAFLFGGVVYKPGALFDYDRINADWNRVRLLFDQRKIEIVPITDVVESIEIPVSRRRRRQEVAEKVIEEVIEEQDDSSDEDEEEDTDTEDQEDEDDAPVVRRRRRRD